MNLINQVTGTVKWRETMLLANEAGCPKNYRIRKWKSTYRNCKRMIENVSILNIENSADLEKIL